MINTKIIKEIKECHFFSILADEVTDCSNKEQMPLVVRYVDGHERIQERFLKFIYCNTGTSGKALTGKIVSSLRDDFNLDIMQCRGQCYDGAGNMAGKYSGVAARILEENRLALYTHCASHRLNLCVASACKIQNIKNMMDNVEKISKFFNNSPKRQALLEEMVKQHLPHYSHTKLIDPCRTRWVLRIDSLARFLEMYTVIFDAISIMSDNIDKSWDGSAADAYALCSLMANFDFIITLVITRNLLGYTKSATIQLQGAEIDLIEGLRQVKVMMRSLQTARDVIDGFHSVWFKDASNIAESVDAAIKAPRICSRQIFRGNIAANDVSTYFKRNVSVPFLDHLLTELSARFTDENCIAIQGISIVPAIMQKQYDSPVGRKRTFVDDHCEQYEKGLENESATHPVMEPNVTSTGSKKVRIQRIDKPWKHDFLKFCRQYANDLPDPSSVSHEVDNWESKWGKIPMENVPQNLSQTLLAVNPTSYPNIYKALKILAVLPITSCTCERSASSVRLLKTYLRSTMSQDRLNGLATIYAHKDIKLNIEEVIERFARRNKRKLNMLNILDTDKNITSKDESVISEIY